MFSFHTFTFSGDKVINGDKEKTGGSGGEEEPEEDACHFYDKTKSFFDNISCEATERAKRQVFNRLCNQWLSIYLLKETKI